jgi:prephenate dehydrogenase
MPHALGIVGYGQLGQVLGSLARTHGLEFRAFDSVGGTVGSLAEAVSGAQTVLLAVPLQALPDALRAMRPLLSSGQLVADTCSVKLESARAMRDGLGSTATWVGTHPLFGPRAHAAGERLRAVVCPDAAQPQAADRAEALYQKLGCEVIKLDADAHDRWMAQTHALAVFLCRGLLDAGLAQGGAPSTPSFETLRDLAARVAKEPEHLQRAIVGHNPYGPATRARALEALEALDAASVEMPHGDPERVLAAARDRIDVLDHRLMVVLRRRAELMKHISRAKRQLGRPVHDPEREARVFAARAVWAKELELDPDLVQHIFEAVLAYARALQSKDQGG